MGILPASVKKHVNEGIKTKVAFEDYTLLIPLGGGRYRGFYAGAALDISSVYYETGPFENGDPFFATVSIAESGTNFGIVQPYIPHGNSFALTVTSGHIPSGYTFDYNAYLTADQNYHTPGAPPNNGSVRDPSHPTIHQFFKYMYSAIAPESKVYVGKLILVNKVNEDDCELALAIPSAFMN